jgi:hypothetical protein
MTRYAAVVLSDGLHHVGRLRAFFALYDIERYDLAFREGLEPLPLDGGKMHEHVPAAAVGLDETVSLRLIEPLYFPIRHDPCSLLVLRLRSGDAPSPIAL